MRRLLASDRRKNFLYIRATLACIERHNKMRKQVRVRVRMSERERKRDDQAFIILFYICKLLSLFLLKTKKIPTHLKPEIHMLPKNAHSLSLSFPFSLSLCVCVFLFLVVEKNLRNFSFSFL